MTLGIVLGYVYCISENSGGGLTLIGEVRAPIVLVGRTNLIILYGPTITLPIYY